MFLSKLTLKNFRNYKESEFKFTKQTTLFIGPNTAGKTNLLEAIYFLSYGKSFRAGSDKDCVKWEEEIARVSGEVAQGNKRPEDQMVRETRELEKVEIEVVLTRGGVNGQKTPSKKYLINGIAKRQVDFVGTLKCVLFRPEDLELITDSPEKRREYLNSVLVQVDREYRRCLLAYEKGLRQRNRLLDFIRDGKAGRHQLYFWDKLLIKNGNIITNKRREYIDFLNSRIDIFADLEIEYDLSAISEERLEKYKEEEVAAGATLVGPHRDNLIIYQKKDEKLRDIHDYGSRGEQRLAILSLKLCELDFIEQNSGERPVLLLDDIFSELDKEHQKLVIKTIPKQQTIITTTDFYFISDFLKEIKVIEL